MENNQEFYEMFTSDPNDEPSNLKIIRMGAMENAIK